MTQDMLLCLLARLTRTEPPFTGAPLDDAYSALAETGHVRRVKIFGATLAVWVTSKGRRAAMEAEAVDAPKMTPTQMVTLLRRG